MSLITKERTLESFFTVKLKNKKESTRQHYRYAINDFDTFCKSHFTNELENLIPEFRTAQAETIIDTLQAWINDSKLGNINKKYRVIQINNYLYYRGVKIDPRDMKDLEYQEGQREEREALTDQELKKIMDASKEKQKALYLTLTSSGMRIGECCHLTKGDFDFSQERIKINIKPEYTKKGAGGRTVYISKEAEQYLKPTLDEIGKKDLVFTYGDNIERSIDNYQIQFRRLVDRIGLGGRYGSGTRKKTLHAMRAYFFTKAVQKHGLGYAHKMTGHKGYLEEYNRYTEDQKLKMYLQLEPDLMVYEVKSMPISREEIKNMVNFELLKAMSSMSVEDFLEFKKKNLGLTEKEAENLKYPK